jgi:predicted TIM-barrel fold metal-dependent hydrolase
MITDCHIHYDPDIFPLERMVASMDEHGIEKAALIATMVEPFYLRGRAKKSATDLLRSTLFHTNPLGQFIYETTVDKKGNFILLGKKYRIFDKPDNNSVAEAIAKYPDRFLGWIFINPAAGGDTVAELERWSSVPAMVGVKAHPFWHRYPINKLEPAAAWCREHDYPLLIHLGSKGGGGDFRLLPERYPGLKVLYAHAGIPFFRKLWAYIKNRKDVYIDLSSPYLNRDLVRRAVDFLGAEKCLYGTDGPYGDQGVGEDFDYGFIKSWIDGLPLSDAELEKVLGGNFEAIRKS